MEILVPEVEPYLEGFVCEMAFTKSGDVGENPRSWKWEMYLPYKAIKNMDIVFYNYLQTRYKQIDCFTMDDYNLVRKMPVSTSVTMKLIFQKFRDRHLKETPIQSVIIEP